MTIKEVLRCTVDILSGISVPAGLVEQIGIPVFQSIGNLNECLRAIEADEAKQENSAEVEEDVQL